MGMDQMGVDQVGNYQSTEDRKYNGQKDKHDLQNTTQKTNN